MTEEEYLNKLAEEWQVRQDFASDFFDELSEYEDFTGFEFDL